MDELSVKALLEDLKNSDERVRDRATTELWRCWFHQKGEYGMQILRRSQVSLDGGDVRHALDLLTKLISQEPDFAEAWNRRAVLHYTQGNYKKSLQDCSMVLKLNPIHFGALHGLGLCYAALGEYINAIQAFRRALEIQPFALVNQKLILECTARLN
ncbi:MAG: tetratricopeptide repeat protein [Oscillatoriales cyanobacterium]|uniref:tetratricopeptide repeat protein n=1 Tax=Microcoleus anatoxicus TaxID=2705319 RepID=UPI002973D7AB|nr:MAG: tetratricopeptide repeat protein [Oscillatoriales cyanobacterium]TAE99487.1 MAG: tetratricopeptide repeat protein [Oscillatoriales cyanobacterium]TAF34032.1 MAG: tetratricopeptide repeat protein [Oscillatoriales cyanobacterium]TAF69956.1 MAG: tetratricopeptide repeat protein [Oscillatoriales cyanobacterium]